MGFVPRRTPKNKHTSYYYYNWGKTFRVRADEVFYDPEETFESSSEEEVVLQQPKRIADEDMKRFQLNHKNNKKKSRGDVVQEEILPGSTEFRRAISSDASPTQRKVVLKRSISHTPSNVRQAVLRASRRREKDTCLRDLIVLREERHISLQRFESLRQDLNDDWQRSHEAVRTIRDLSRHRVPFYRHPGFMPVPHQDEEDDSKIDVVDEIETKDDTAPALIFSSSSSSSEDEDEDDVEVVETLNIEDEIERISNICDEVVHSTNTTPNLLYVCAKRRFEVLFRLSDGPLDMLVLSSRHSKDTIRTFQENNTSLFGFVNELLRLHRVESEEKEEEEENMSPGISNPNVESGLRFLNLLPTYSFMTQANISKIANEKASDVLRSIVPEDVTENSLLRFRALQILKECRWNVSEAESKAKSDLPNVLRAYVVYCSQMLHIVMFLFSLENISGTVFNPRPL